MQFRKMLGLAGALLAAAILVASAGAGTSRVKHGIDLSTRAKVTKYLRSLGIDPKGVVIQRGRLNYAGAHCPGARWHCVAVRGGRAVVQIGTAAGGSNSYECSPSYGVIIIPGGASTQGDESVTCTVVQVAPEGSTMTNTAKCVEHSDSPVEACDISQTNALGDNVAIVDQVIDQNGSPAESASQNANIDQTNVQGKNDATTQQRVTQTSSTTALPMAVIEGPPTQSQTNDQISNVSQTNGTGDNNSDRTQRTDQKETIGQDGVTQNQDNNIQGHVDQSTTGGLSTSDNHQDEHQIELGGTIQHQHGPVGCCTSQVGNPKNKFGIHQVTNQFTSSPTSDQTEFISGECFTSGNCDVTQHANENGNTANNQASGPAVFLFIACGDVGELGASTIGSSSNTGVCVPSQGGIG